MPVHCPVEIPRISEDEMRSVDYRVMKHVFKTHNKLGRFADERVYHHELQRRLAVGAIQAAVGVPIYLSFRQFSTTLAIDLIAEEKVIYELKAVSALLAKHESQLLNYMFLTNATRGKLVNFRASSVEWKFVNTSRTVTQRRQATLVKTEYGGPDSIPDLVQDLVLDWGTGLDATLYRRAILCNLSTEVNTEQMLPMTSGGQTIGNQRFHMLSSDVALGVTAFEAIEPGNKADFERLVAASPLKQFHWVNITHGSVALTTIR